MLSLKILTTWLQSGKRIENFSMMWPGIFSEQATLWHISLSFYDYFNNKNLK